MMEFFAQKIMDALFNKKSRCHIDQYYYSFLLHLRKLMLKICDPLVTYYFLGTQLLIPFSHNLPIFISSYPNYSINLGRIGKCVYQKYPSLKLIDIGANIGDSVVILRQFAFYPILCIEGSANFYKLLSHNTHNLQDVYLSNTFISCNNNFLHASLVIESGTARLQNGHTKIKVNSLDEVLIHYPMFLDSKMLKVDTDGMDGIILKGSLDFLNKTHPVIFFEYDPYFYKLCGDDGLSLFKNLRNIGYETALVYNNFGEYFLSFRLDNTELISDLNLYYTGWKGNKYFDICVFHEEDDDLAQIIHSAEVNYYRKMKNA
ncbi:MAG: FkbM family methyltransferase [Candidatus Atribacteria bacterium]|nr:FkbM family methyltransferase [Candidatus Atribacteria bacterium]